MRTRACRSIRLTGAAALHLTAALLLAGALLTPAPALGTDFCRFLDRFPATGQETCWDSAGTEITCAGTGQDGDVQAGGTLRYKDLGNGTILDRNTLLIWEKKSDDGSIHDKDTQYDWDQAFAVHVADLNTANFAGRHDWRLPNVKELQSIVDYETFNPAVDPAFNNGDCAGGTCTVLTCSCTGTASSYWSSSTKASFPPDAWNVGFNFGSVNASDKDDFDFVRAVRGGCVD